MFDIGALELLIVAIMALVVVGPKDLPRLIKTFLDFFSKIKNMSRNLREGLDDLAREVDINPEKDFKDLDPFQEERLKEGLSPDMTPEEITAHIMSNKSDAKLEEDKTDNPKPNQSQDLS